MVLVYTRCCSQLYLRGFQDICNTISTYLQTSKIQTIIIQKKKSRDMSSLWFSNTYILTHMHNGVRKYLLKKTTIVI